MKLDKHLIATVRPNANPENVVLWKSYRLTVLGERLFRLERSETLKFRDDATQSVWFRDMPKQAFCAVRGEDALTVETSRCKLIIKEKREDCRICLDGGAPIAIDNAGNLKGTYRTLDRCNGNVWRSYQRGETKTIELGTGVCSKTGVAVLPDENSLSLGKDGEIKPLRGEGTDEYIFAFGSDFRAAVAALYQITGAPPLVPRFAFGNWWSRYRAYTQEEYMQVLQRFEDNDVPLTVATIDMDWHYSDLVDEEKGISASGKIGEEYGTRGGHGILGWTGYSWNKNLFPDHKQMLREIKERGLKITLNLHPADGVRFWEDCYEDMARAMGLDPATGKQVAFDIADTKFINAYFSLLHKPLEAEGVDFWWIDWQQGTKTKVEGLDPLWALNHYHYYDDAKNHATPLILSRYAGVGAHRYPLGFSGDTDISWKTLAYLAYFTATASNVGYTWWSHDIGGHHSGEKNDELYVRHLQFGVFNPINRLHCTNWETLCKEPFLFGNGAGAIAKEWMRMRHRMLPYLYSASQKTHTQGRALVEPLYYEWSDEKAFEYSTEYLFGGQLLVAPVITARAADGYSRTRVWLPEGEWTDIFTGTTYVSPKGGVEKTLRRKLDEMPVFARSGAIFPTSLERGNGVENPARMQIEVWKGNGEFTLFEDDREEGGTNEFFTEFVSSYRETDGAGIRSLIITSRGADGVVPQTRTLKIVFKGAPKGNITVKKNGEAFAVRKCYGDNVTLELPFEAFAEYEITVVVPLCSRLEEEKAQVLRELMLAEGNNVEKFSLWKKIKEADDEERIRYLIDVADLSDGVKERVKEALM
ncbi:MAG: alpha-xylosidase [Clostridia bacterium]|nr:alpha-xylosidase [Clostridia bacterium]